jgi:hypothetical protein
MCLIGFHTQSFSRVPGFPSRVPRFPSRVPRFPSRASGFATIGIIHSCIQFALKKLIKNGFGGGAFMLCRQYSSHLKCFFIRIGTGGPRFMFTHFLHFLHFLHFIELYLWIIYNKFILFYLFYLFGAKFNKIYLDFLNGTQPFIIINCDDFKYAGLFFWPNAALCWLIYTHSSKWRSPLQRPCRP